MGRIITPRSPDARGQTERRLRHRKTPDKGQAADAAPKESERRLRYSKTPDYGQSAHAAPEQNDGQSRNGTTPGEKQSSLASASATTTPRASCSRCCLAVLTALLLLLTCCLPPLLHDRCPLVPLDRSKDPTYCLSTADAESCGIAAWWFGVCSDAHSAEPEYKKCTESELVDRVRTIKSTYSENTCQQNDESDTIECLQGILRRHEAKICAEIPTSKLFNLLIVVWMLFVLISSIVWPLMANTPQREPPQAWMVVRLFMATGLLATAVVMPELFHTTDPFKGIAEWAAFLADMVAYLHHTINSVVVAELKADYVSELLSMPYRGISAGVTVLYSSFFLHFGKDRTLELTKYCVDLLCLEKTLLYTFCLVSPVLIFQITSTLDTLGEVTGIVNDLVATWAFGSTVISSDDLLSTYGHLPSTGLLPLVVLLCSSSDVIVFSWPWSMSWIPTCAWLLAGLFFAESIRAVIGMSVKWALLATGLLLMMIGLSGARFVTMLLSKLKSFPVYTSEVLEPPAADKVRKTAKPQNTKRTSDTSADKVGKTAKPRKTKSSSDARANWLVSMGGIRTILVDVLHRFDE